jgi:hypothetical protein
MRDRTKEVERLKKQLQKLQQAQESPSSNSPTPERDASVSGSSTPSRRDTHQSNQAESTPPMITASDWMGGYMQVWSQTPEQEQLSGLGLTTDGENPMNFDTSSFFPTMPSNEDYVSAQPANNSRTRAVSTSNITSPPVPQHQHMRSNSNPPFFSRCGSPTSPWPAQRSDSRDSLQVPGMASTPSPLMLDHHNQSSLLALSPASFTLYTNPEELLPHPDSSFSLDDNITPTNAYPTPPDSDLNGGSSSWSTFDGKAIQRARSPSSASTFLSNLSAGEVPGSLPETQAPLLHLAVAGGHLDTLRLLLQRFDISINGKDTAGYTPLQRAVMSGRTDMVAVLLEYGACINGDDVFGGSAEGEHMNMDTTH